ncbi:MAG: hypothetical protein GY948_11045 [Alphaproteobacteria bacterium]|nr:hypothetical protein [Alphaproteobacteria bacterium]
MSIEINNCLGRDLTAGWHVQYHAIPVGPINRLHNKNLQSAIDSTDTMLLASIPIGTKIRHGKTKSFTHQLKAPRHWGTYRVVACPSRVRGLSGGAVFETYNTTKRSVFCSQVKVLGVAGKSPDLSLSIQSVDRETFSNVFYDDEILMTNSVVANVRNGGIRSTKTPLRFTRRNGNNGREIRLLFKREIGALNPLNSTTVRWPEAVLHVPVLRDAQGSIVSSYETTLKFCVGRAAPSDTVGGVMETNLEDNCRTMRFTARRRNVCDIATRSLKLESYPDAQPPVGRAPGNVLVTFQNIGDADCSAFRVRLSRRLREDMPGNLLMTLRAGALRKGEETTLPFVDNIPAPQGTYEYYLTYDGADPDPISQNHRTVHPIGESGL